MSNKLTETNNWGVKFFFPCIHKSTKYPIFIQVFVYLSCATSTWDWQNVPELKYRITAHFPNPSHVICYATETLAKFEAQEVFEKD